MTDAVRARAEAVKVVRHTEGRVDFRKACFAQYVDIAIHRGRDVVARDAVACAEASAWFLATQPTNAEMLWSSALANIRSEQALSIAKLTDEQLDDLLYRPDQMRYSIAQKMLGCEPVPNEEEAETCEEDSLTE